MPHLQLPGDVSLFYDFPCGAPDPSKPSVLLLAPALLNTLFLAPHVEALKDAYSVCTVDLRGQGRSSGGASPNFDHWVAAADMAFFMDALQLPASHIFAPGHAAFRTALNLAILFPERVLTLSIVGAMSLFGPPRNVAAFQEVNQQWSFPADTDLWVECLGAIGEYTLTKYEGHEREWDTVLPTIARHYNPYRQANIYISTAPNLVSTGIDADLLATVKQPVLLIHGEQDLAFPTEEIEVFRRHLRGSPDVRFHIELEAPQLVAITHVASTMPRVRSFLDDYRHLSLPPSALDCTAALERAARIARNPEIAKRDPRLPDSFSLLSYDERRANQARWDEMMQRQAECQVALPMCFEKDDWEDGAETQRRWKWSNREEYAQQHYARRPSSLISFGDAVTTTVEVTESRSTVSSTLGNKLPAHTVSIESRRTSANCEEDDIPPPVPPKDRTTLRV